MSDVDNKDSEHSAVLYVCEPQESGFLKLGNLHLYCKCQSIPSWQGPLPLCNFPLYPLSSPARDAVLL